MIEKLFSGFMLSVIALAAALLVWLCLQLPSVIRHERDCINQGGVPLRGACVKVETIKIVE